jgi:hypothetical protein
LAVSATAEPAPTVEDPLASLQGDAVDQLVAAFAELEWAEARALAALDGARAAGLPPSAITELTGIPSYNGLMRYERRLRLQGLWRSR